MSISTLTETISLGSGDPSPPLPSPTESEIPSEVSAFGPWKGFSQVKNSYRLVHPLHELTVGLKDFPRHPKNAVEIRAQRWTYPPEWDSKPLGSGSYGIVYSLLDAKTEGKAAFKLYDKEKDALKELSLLHHLQPVRHLVRCYGGIQKDLGRMRVVMEQVGQNLTSLLKDYGQKTFPFRDAVQLTLQLFEFHEDMARRGYAHADLSANNIVYENGKVTVLDIGLAHTPETDQKNPNRIQTLAVRAPEVLLGKKYDASIDAWSIGALFFQLFTDRPLITVDQDDRICQTIVLAILMSRIGEPSEEFLRNCKARDLFEKGKELLPMWKQSLFNVEQMIQRTVRLHRLSPEISALVTKLFKGTLCYENRIAPSAAVALCKELLAKLD